MTTFEHINKSASNLHKNIRHISGKILAIDVHVISISKQIKSHKYLEQLNSLQSWKRVDFSDPLTRAYMTQRRNLSRMTRFLAEWLGTLSLLKLPYWLSLGYSFIESWPNSPGRSILARWPTLIPVVAINWYYNLIDSLRSELMLLSYLIHETHNSFRIAYARGKCVHIWRYLCSFRVYETIPIRYY